MKLNQFTQKCDVLVAGAGPAGLMTAGLLAKGGVSTTCVGPVAGAGDTRTTALFSGAEQLLDHLGALRHLASQSAPLEAMRIIDRLSGTDHPSSLIFPALEIGRENFGSNYRNIDLLAALERVGSDLPSLTRIHAMITDYDIKDEGIEVHLADGRTVMAKAVAACDGRGSPARKAADISATTWDYSQTALAFQTGHGLAHANVSIEVHRPGGPLTFIPLPGDNCAVNWLVSPDTAKQLAALDDAAFADALFEASGGVLGQFNQTGRRAAFPITGLSVDRLAKNRTFLIGEAAHVLPPIGAQGLNLGFRDAAVFSELAIDAKDRGQDPGSSAQTETYVRARTPDIMTRRTATDLLNRSLLFGSGALPHLRGLGMVLLASSKAARRKLMLEGMGGDTDPPRLMRRHQAIS